MEMPLEWARFTAHETCAPREFLKEETMFKKTMIGAILAASVCCSALVTAQDRPDDVGASHEAAVQRVLPGARVTMMAFNQGVSKISRVRVATSGATFEARANDFLARHAAAMGLDAQSLRAVRTEAAAGRTVVSYRQMHGELPIIDRSLSVMMTAEGDVVRVQSDLVPLGDVVQGPVEAATASAIATSALWGDVPFAALNAERVVVSLENGRAMVVWAVHVPLRALVDHMVVLVDSRDGQIIEVRNRTILN